MTDHLRKAGRNMAKGTKNAANALSEGRVLDATRSAANGTAETAREIAKSAVKNSTNLFQDSQDTNI